MKSKIIKNFAVALMLAAVLTAAASSASYAQNQQVASTHKVNTLAILFTGDLHSCANKYPQLAALIKSERASLEKNGCAVITVDAGDIAMGSVFSAVTNLEASEYRALGLMGYDAYVFGNHDFDIGLKALAFMFYNANIQGRNLDPVTKQPINFPVNVTANLGQTQDETFEQARKYIGQQSYIILNRNGMKIGIFGLLGKRAFDVSNQKEDMTLVDPVEMAKKVVAALKSQGVDFIICLSHSGSLLGEKSEDGILAKKCPDIDVIISGHDHQAIFNPWKVGNVIIAASGSGGDLLGEMQILKGNKSGNPVSYKLIKTDSCAATDASAKNLLDSTDLKVVGKFNQQFNISPFDVIAKQDKSLRASPEKDGSFPLAYAVARSYFYQAVDDYEYNVDTSLMVSCVPAGIVRKGLAAGEVTYSDVFNVIPLGLDRYGKLGYPVIEVWITGKELKKLCELNVSIAPKMPDALMTFYGLTYTYNSARLPFTKIIKVYVHGKQVVNDKLYHVITGYYTAMCLDVLSHNSYGILKIVPKDSKGNEMYNIDKLILGHHVVGYKYPQGTNEWFAFAEYLRNYGSQPAATQFAGKDVRNASVWLAYAAYLLVLIMIVFFIIKGISKVVKKSKAKVRN